MVLPQGDGTINHWLPLPDSPALEAPGDQVPSYQVLSKISWSKHERKATAPCHSLWFGQVVLNQEPLMTQPRDPGVVWSGTDVVRVQRWRGGMIHGLGREVDLGRGG